VIAFISLVITSLSTSISDNLFYVWLRYVCEPGKFCFSMQLLISYKQFIYIFVLDREFNWMVGSKLLNELLS
jgi:hypothetical protein